MFGRGRRLVAHSVIGTLLFSLIAAALPPASFPLAPAMAAASGEVLASPHFIGVALMPNGQVGMIFQNVTAGVGEIRFKRYTDEQSTDPSIQLSTAAPAYPQLATFRGELVAGYTDTRAPNNGRFVFRISSDNGATWGPESYPFGSETFDSGVQFTPVVTTSRDGQTLYFFTAIGAVIPTFRSTTDLTLVSWTAAAPAGDSSMRTAGGAYGGNNCGNAGAECYRAHDYQFMETAIPGRWVYIAKSDSGFGQSGRGTQYGTLGGAWSAQIDLGGSGGLSGGGESGATTFLDRAGNIYYIRAGEFGENVYFQKSTDNGQSWGPRVYAYNTSQPSYLTAAPVGMYVPSYTQGEYVWWAGFGGTEDTVRVDGIWTQSLPYPISGTARIFGSAGGDWDAGLAWAYTFGKSDPDASADTGVYTTSAEDLALPGRLLNLSFTRWYNSADTTPGPLGPGWTHSYNWKLTDAGSFVVVRRGDGRRDKFTAIGGGAYTDPPNVYDKLVKNGDGSFTLTLTNQVQYEFVGPAQDSAYPATVQADVPGSYWRLGEASGTVAADAGSAGNTGTYSGGVTLGVPGALHDASTAAGFDGSTGKVTAGVAGIASGSSARTVEAWVNPSGNGGTIFATNAASGQKFVVQTFQTGGSWYLFTDGVNPANNLTLSGPEIPPAGVWSHVAFVFDGSANTWDYYLNGVPTRSGTFAVPISTATPTSTTIAERLDTSQPFTGSIDEVAVYASALPASRIAAHYATTIDRGGLLTRIHEPAGNQITLGYSGTNLTSITDTVGRSTILSYASGDDLANAKTYSESTPPSGNYPDSGGTELTDANLGSPTDFHDAAWQGHANLASPLDVTIDLGSSQPIGLTRSFQFDSPSDGIYKPASVEVLTSTDNVTYVSRGTTLAAAAVNDAGRRWRYDVNANTTARWVRFRITTGGIWLFTSELQAFVQGASGVDFTQFGDRLSRIQDPLGRQVTYSYDASARLTAVVDKLGNTAGQNPSQHTWQYGYEPVGQHITTITDPDGRVRVTNTYDSAGRLFTQKDGLQKQTSFAYSPSQTVVTDPKLHQTTLTYDPRARLLSQSDVVSGVTRTLQYAYDDLGNRNAVIDRDGNRTDFLYDTRGNVLTKTDPQLNPQTPRYVTTFTYDSKNNVTQILDPRNFTTTNTYDPTTNVLLSTTAQIDPTTSAVTKYEYADGLNPGLPTKIIAPRGNTGPTPNYTYAQSLTYDAQANLVTRIDADGAKTTYGYDSVGRRTTMVDPDGYGPGGVPSEHTWSTAYDANDRVTTQTDPLSHSTTNGYNNSGDRTTLTDRNGNSTTYGYDTAARLATVVQKPDPVGQPSLVYTTSVTRDDNGNATTVTQANGVVTDYTFDELNRLKSVITHPTVSTSLTTSYVLNGNGQPTTKTTGDGAAITYGYDTMARLTSVAATGLTTITYGYDALSHRITMTDGSGNTTYAYDGLGRLTQAVQPNGTTTYSYDLDSNRTTLGYPSVGNVTYTYSPGGRLNTVTDWATHNATYGYTPAGLASSVSVPGGMTTTYTYDTAHRLTQLVNAVGANTVSSHTYALDNEGNRIALDEAVSGITAPPIQSFPSVKVNTDTGTTVQDHPAIALGADAASYLIWDDARLGNADIEFARRDPVTGAWSANVKVNTDTQTRIQQNPAIALDSSNNAYAVWQDERNGAGKADIYYAKRTASNGTWLTPNLKVSDDPAGGGGAVQRNPRIAGTAAGTETAVWVDLRSSQTNIYSSTLASGGSTWAANKKVTDNTAALKDNPDVIVGSDGTSYAVWQDSRNANPDIYFSKLTSGGSTWSANVKVSDDPGTAAQTAPRIGIDSAGNLTVIWLDARTSPPQVRVSRQTAGSNTWSASTVLSDAAARPNGTLAIAERSDGNAWVAWSDTRASSTDIWGAQYSAGPGTWSTSQLLSDDPGAAAQSNPTVAYSTAELASAWRDDRAGNADVRAARITYSSGLDHFGYSYDGLERLTAGTTTNAESFTLDPGSNIASRTGPSATYTYDTANRLTSDGTQAFTWNTADRLTNRGSDTFGYDALDRMTSSTVTATARSYAYNGDGLLQSRTQGTSTTFLWDPSSSPSRLLVQGGDRLVYGLGPLWVVKADGSTSSFARDGGKSVRAEVNGSGSVTASFRYRAYGAIAQSSGVATPSYLGYAGQLQDPSGLLYMRARWYDPNVGRFTTRDPVFANPTLPVALNAFAYANANPAMRTDASGLCAGPAAVVCVVVLWPEISAGAIVVWTATTAGVGAFIWLATHDDVGRPKVEASPTPKHAPIPEGQIDEHKVKRENDIPKGVDLYWDPETGDVYAHPRDAQGRIRGEGELIGNWDDLLEDYPKGGPR